jgi:hypothetical protein
MTEFPPLYGWQALLRDAFYRLAGVFLWRWLRDGSTEKGAISPSLTAALPGAEAEACTEALPAEHPVSSRVGSYLQTDVPVYVPCFNNPTYTAGMVSQLRDLGFGRIVLVDGGSTYPPMRKLLDTPGDAVSVVRLPGNPGPRHVFLDPASFALLPRHFCVTDPDLTLNPAMPPGLPRRSRSAGRARAGGEGRSRTRFVRP